MSILKEFKEFAIKGNLIDMSVAFVMGAAFGKVVTGFIEGIVMPIVGKLSTGVDFRSMKWVLTKAKLDDKGNEIVAETSIKYGEFITIVIDFTLVAFFMFILIKAINQLKRKKEKEASETVPELTTQELLLTEIRDLLKNNKG
jgi:large conductance mechanosensitive channel